MKVLLKLLIGASVLTVLVLASIGSYLRSQLDPEHLRQLAELKATETLGRSVKIGSIQTDDAGNVTGAEVVSG